jgi:Meckel syndrome type 1 protein
VESRVLCAVGLMVLVALPVQAADSTAKAAETAESAESAAAMARVKRQAANPLKVILEASKMKRKAAPASDAPVAPAGPATATVALSSANTSNTTLVTRAVIAAEALPTSKGADRITVTSDLPSAVPPIAALTSGWTQPRLVEMVEPAIPARVLDEIGQLVELRADLTLRADGSVASVTLLPPVPRQLVRYVTAALERWRYAPLPAGQVHRVQLVFNER